MHQDIQLTGAAATLALAAAGCTSFQPKPILEQEILRELQAIRLEALQPADHETKADTRAVQFNPADGLSDDEAIAVALYLNPDLQAFRKERGVAEGERISAGLFANPELQVTWLNIESFTKSFATGGIDVGLNWAPPRPGERGIKQARANARIAEVHVQIAGEEWRLAAEVRKAYTTLLAVEERLRITETLLQLQERIRRYFQAKRRLGDASRLDLNLVEIVYVDTLRERETARNERNQVRQAFNRLLGLPPLYEVKLQITGDPLAYRPYALEPIRLEAVMIERRPELHAAKQVYAQAEQSLRLAYLQRIPWPKFGPAYARDEIDGKAGNRWGINVGVELPIAHLNQGEIARLEAGRDKLREEFKSLVHRDRAELNEAYRELRAQERLIRLYQESIQPALDESTKLTEAGIELGEFNLVQLITTQDRVLKSRREFINAQLDYWKAVFDLERALGARLSEIAGEEP